MSDENEEPVDSEGVSAVKALCEEYEDQVGPVPMDGDTFIGELVELIAKYNLYNQVAQTLRYFLLD